MNEYPRGILDDMAERKFAIDSYNDLLQRINEAVRLLELAEDNYAQVNYHPDATENEPPWVIGRTRAYVELALEELKRK